MLFARDVLSRNPGATIVGEVKCSQTLYDDIAQHGGQRHHVEDRPLAHQGEDEGDGRAARRRDERPHLLHGSLLRLRRRDLRRRPPARDPRRAPAGRSPSCSPTCRRRVTTPEIRVDCPDEVKFARRRPRARPLPRRRATRSIDVDGVRVRFPHGWGLVRASNTQPVLVMRFEAADAGAAGRVSGARSRRPWPRARAELGASDGPRAREASIVDPRGPRAQSQERRRRHPARPARRRHRALRLGQVVARLRHALRRRAAALRRVALGLRAAVPRADGEARLRRASTGCRRRSRSSRRASGANPRSTVGTVTEIADYLRLLFARVGEPICWPVRAADRGADGAAGRRPPASRCRRRRGFCVYAPVVRDRKGEHKKELDELRRGGFVRVRVDGELRELADDIVAREDRPRTRSRCWSTACVVRPGIEQRLADSLEVGVRARRRHRAGRGRRAGRRRAAAAALQPAPRLPDCGVSLPGARAALLLVQQPARRVPRLRRPRRRARASIPALIVPDADEPLPPALSRRSSRARCPSLDETSARRSRRTTGSRSRRRGRSCPTAARTALLDGIGRRGDRRSGRTRGRRTSAGRSRACVAVARATR